ncbi:MAG: 2Fe-2S iron-sulfur cluster-binding protein [Rikenellaceae bacterium]|nr:2Fe-2S iron-sulfur cluster-binding protein [Rikenellaceae bacterium]MCL2692731.1 2Fe-2S iron-sulfur cluster-binding protein [Rikenellaceae bacterium]
MKIRINDKETEVSEGEKVIEVARRLGIGIPALCYAPGFKHRASCMVCVVKELTGGRMIPACSTPVAEGMDIQTESEEVKQLRAMSLELLLSDHRADCEAPCSTVCPYGLDIELMLGLYDTGRLEEAHALIAAAFALPVLGCEGCKVPCEKACRRASVDKAVPIRTVIGELAKKHEPPRVETKAKTKKETEEAILFQSRLGRFTESEKELLKDSVTTPSGCLHCACEGREGCKLRLYSAEAGIKRTRYEMSSASPAMTKLRVTDTIRFEPAKCIKCGLCVYNSNDGFTFSDRGFGMQVVLPAESAGNVGASLCEICPTGALYIGK